MAQEFIYTYQCTAQCQHCCFSCSPDRTEKIDYSVAIEIIEQAITMPNFKNFFFSGGEVFLYYDELISLISKINKKKNILCATNGAWGFDKRNARQKIRELKQLGVTQLLVSYDEFHAEYIPASAIRNILCICQEFCLSVEISSMASRRSWRIPNTADALLKDIVGIPISEAALLPVGAAKQRICDNEYIMENTRKNDLCLSADAVTILPNGDIYPCCSPAGLSIPVLKLGNIQFDDLERMINSSNMTVIECLKKYGIKKTCKHLWPDIILREKQNYINTCDKCYHLLTQVK